MSHTPMMQQYLEIKSRVPDKILFYRLGDFYEMFYDDAVKASKALNLTLTSRNSGSGKKAPLCGVPYHAADTYIAKLVKQGYDVAICEQVEDPKNVKGIVKREIIRIITPGTIIETDMLDSKENNYLLACDIFENYSTLAYVDISTFDLKLSIIESKNHRELLINEIKKISPQEILTNQENSNLIKELNISKVSVLKDTYFKNSNTLSLFKKINMSLNNSDQSLKNIVSALLEYLLQIHMVNLDQEFSVEIYKDEQYVNIDQKAIRNLELFETLIDREKRGSLIYILDHASTQMGSRLLKQWLKRPLKDVEKIKKRHDIVEFLINSSIFNLEIISILSQISDIERIIAKVNYRTVLPKELIRLGESLFKISELKHLISKKAQLNYISSKLETFENLAHKILNTIKEDPTNNLSDGGYIREGVNVELDEINILIRDASKILLDLENREKENTGIKNLKIKYNKVFGYFFEISNGNLDRVPDYFIRKQTLVNNERFFTEELKNIEDKIVNAKDIKKELEDKIFKELIETINPYSTNIINSSQCISELDILSNFAQLSINNSWVRPQFNNKNELDIKEARHPVIENMIGRDNFISNDLYMNSNTDQFLILTGPNMAGKSTYLRTIAIIAIMAQIGCFVPCSHANIKIFDQIFTRVGASDNLSAGESTFMVEMNELAYILSHATNDSLVILDEIGRGTSTYDGLSIAWSLVEYLTEYELHPFTLFATHYHELTEIEEKIKSVKNYRVLISEISGELVFLRKIVRGPALKSYGIQAASLAGLPSKLIDRAKEILDLLQKQDIVKNNEDTNNEKTKDIKVDNYREVLENIDIDETIDKLLQLRELIK